MNDDKALLVWWERTTTGWPLPEHLDARVRESLELGHDFSTTLDRSCPSDTAWFVCRFAVEPLERRRALAFSARTYGELCQVLPFSTFTWRGLGEHVRDAYSFESLTAREAPKVGILDELELSAQKDVCAAGEALFDSIRMGWNATEGKWRIVARDVANALAQAEYTFTLHYPMMIPISAVRRVSSMLDELDHVSRLLAARPWLPPG